MGRSALLSLCLCLVLFHGCSAFRQQPRPVQSRHRFQQQQGNECQIDNFQALEPQNRVQCEAGLIETWDHNEEQLQCAGVTMVRYTIEPNGLLLPSFSNAPMLMYVVQGKGLHAMVVPGCPETYQSVEEPQQSRHGHSQSFQDQHQKVRRISQGDVVAMLAGVSYWIHNDDTQNELVVVALFDTTNSENQLDSNPRKFYLAGNPQDAFQGKQRSQKTCNNIFCGFDEEILAQAFNIDIDLVRQIQSQNDNRKNIVKVEGKLHLIRPQLSQEEEQMRRENGLEETMCAMSIKQNIGNPSTADIFTPQAGWLSTVNSNSLPILRWIQLSAAKGVLYKNSMLAPSWVANAHSIFYVIRGSAWMQVVDNNGNAVFDGEVTEGQVVTVPQNFAVVQRTENNGFEFVVFKTNDNAMRNTLAGKTSVMRALPAQVIANSYHISPEEARKLKFNRMETLLFNLESSPRIQMTV